MADKKITDSSVGNALKSSIGVASSSSNGLMPSSMISKRGSGNIIHIVSIKAGENTAVFNVSFCNSGNCGGFCHLYAGNRGSWGYGVYVRHHIFASAYNQSTPAFYFTLNGSVLEIYAKSNQSFHINCSLLHADAMSNVTMRCVAANDVDITTMSSTSAV